MTQKKLIIQKKICCTLHVLYSRVQLGNDITICDNNVMITFNNVLPNYLTFIFNKFQSFHVTFTNFQSFHITFTSNNFHSNYLTFTFNYLQSNYLTFTFQQFSVKFCHSQVTFSNNRCYYNKEPEQRCMTDHHIKNNPLSLFEINK